MQATAISDVIAATLASFSALTIPVYDGTPITVPSDIEYVIIGGDLEPNSDIAVMNQEWRGLGYKVRMEELIIRCTAVGRASRVNDARELALDAIQQVAESLSIKPTENTYNALVDSVEQMVSSIAQSGVTVRAMFTIRANARLIQ